MRFCMTYSDVMLMSPIPRFHKVSARGACKVFDELVLFALFQLSEHELCERVELLLCRADVHEVDGILMRGGGGGHWGECERKYMRVGIRIVP